MRLDKDDNKESVNGKRCYNSLTLIRKIYKTEYIQLLMKKRVQFAEGKQKDFFKNLKEKTNLSWKELSNQLNVNESTLSKAYRFGFCDIPYSLFINALELINKNERDALKDYNAKVINELVIIGRKVFGERKKLLKPIKIDYKNNRLDLDTSKVNFSKYDIKRKIKLPRKLTPELAEEIGMHFGDGFLSKSRFEYRLKGNQNNEREYYQDYIKPLFKILYNIEITPKDFKDSYGFELKSKAIWEFKTKVIKIKSGKKDDLCIPEILKVNNTEILSAFLRGLFDTDGSLRFKSQYGYEKYYPVIELSLLSKNIIKEVGAILNMFGFNIWLGFNDKYGRISLSGISNFQRYEKLIGWSSPKNLNKVNDWKKQYPELSRDMMDVVQRLRYGTVAPEKRVRLPPSILQNTKRGNLK